MPGVNVCSACYKPIEALPVVIGMAGFNFLIRIFPGLEYSGCPFLGVFKSEVLLLSLKTDQQRCDMVDRLLSCFLGV